VAHTGVVDLYPDLVGAGREDFDIFDDEVLAGFPGHGGLAGDGLAFSGGHDCVCGVVLLFLCVVGSEGGFVGDLDGQLCVWYRRDVSRKRFQWKKREKVKTSSWVLLTVAGSSVSFPQQLEAMM
jgi:hypothetical protein